jgi:polygalacturonase
MQSKFPPRLFSRSGFSIRYFNRPEGMSHESKSMKILSHRHRSLYVVLVLAIMGFFDCGVALAVPALPVINTNNIINITSAPYNAIGDGVITNTSAIQAAINAAALGGTTNGAAGGTVKIPAGVYLSAPFTLKSKVNLQLDNGAILRMLSFTNYPKLFFTNVTASFVTNGIIVTTIFSTNITWTATNFISGKNLTDLEISGAGMIQGQGEPWWPYANTNGDTRPIMISLSGCSRVLIQNLTLSNSPEFHISVNGSDTTVQGVTIRANSSSDPVNPGHNTDACDVSGTHVLVQNNNISVGDDNYTCSGGTSDVLITNNVYGNGHGTSIGSFTSPSVLNLTIVNCTYTNEDAGLRIKSDRDRGGFVDNICYYNLSMTNVKNPILIYTEYTNTATQYRTLDSISPTVAASYSSAPVVIGKTPMYRDITISNLTANAQATRAAGLIWGLPELSISNVTLVNVHLIGSKTFGIYDAKNVRIINTTHSVPNGVSQFSIYNTDITFSNSTPSAALVTLDGATTNGFRNKLSLFNTLATLRNTNAIDGAPLVIGASTLIISNHFNFNASSTASFNLGTNAATIVVTSNLFLGGTINLMAGDGFTNATYTLFIYKNLSWGPPTLGSAPAGYTYSLDTNTLGQVNLIVSPPAPSAPTNIAASATNANITVSWSPVATAVTYNVKRSTDDGGPYPTIFSGIIATNYTDTLVTNGTTYYYVISSVNSGGESANSIQASATVTQLQPSLSPPMLVPQILGSQLQLSWPSDHLGWRLEIQTNDLSAGLGTNWFTVPDSTNVIQTNLTINPVNGAVFLRLVYP